MACAISISLIVLKCFFLKLTFNGRNNDAQISEPDLCWDEAKDRNAISPSPKDYSLWRTQDFFLR
jgi:hypothetical protein